MLLSASRRTDIPSYYSEWFLNRLKEGYALTRNPINRAQVSRVELSPEMIDCIVFWTKDPFHMMDKLEQIDAMGYHYYFQFTITPYGFNPEQYPFNLLSPNHDYLYRNEIERNLRDKKDIIKTFQQLSNRLGKERVLWRYDPIIINDELTIQYHLDRFTMLCQELKGYTNICTISFVDLYSKLSKKVKEEVIRAITPEQMHDMAAAFSSIGHKHGIELRACSESIDLSVDGIKPAACISKDIVEQVCGHVINAKKDKNQRLECGCIQSVDIGVYNTCKNGCIYCYANHSDTSIDNNFEKHDPNSDILIGSVDKNEKIITRKF
ncbi:MAG: hypothetical protein K0S01_3156 [Herbinix sp.]|nr:hypothetical protein [Herbinix sp.]